ncbi:MAG TPA: acyl-CoA dehydrogenase family protein [Acidimicrobiales bacterium]
MYPLLNFEDDAWAREAPAQLAAFAEEVEDELVAAERAGRFPADIYAEMGKRGWVGPITPKTYGGLGGGVAEYCLVEEEIGRHGLVPVQVSVQGQRWLLDWGSEEQTEQYLEGVARGEIIFSECISEPGGGSSLRNLRATARRSNGDWVIDGVKTHVNLGRESDVTLVYAVAEEGLSAFLVDTSLPGVSATPRDAIGLRLIPTCDMAFENVRVPDSAVLGEPGRGLETFLATFNMSRLGNASELIGYGRRAMTLGTEYAQERRIGDGVLTDYQGIQWTIAEAYERLHAASLARDYAANLDDELLVHGVETSLAKKLAITAAEFAVNEVFSLVGGYGLYYDQAFTRLVNDTKVLRVAGGSLEVLRNFVARTILTSDTYAGLR